MNGKVIVDNKNIYSGYLKFDDFGPFDFQRQFNLVFPLQVKLEYTRLLDQLGDEEKSSQWGVIFYYRELDELSPDEDFEDGRNDHMFEIQTYFEIKF